MWVSKHEALVHQQPQEAVYLNQVLFSGFSFKYIGAFVMDENYDLQILRWRRLCNRSFDDNIGQWISKTVICIDLQLCEIACEIRGDISDMSVCVCLPYCTRTFVDARNVTTLRILVGNIIVIWVDCSVQKDRFTVLGSNHFIIILQIGRMN